MNIDIRKLVKVKINGSYQPPKTEAASDEHEKEDLKNVKQ